MVSERFERVGSRLPHFDSPYLGGFWGPFSEVLERILQSLVNMIFALDFCIGFMSVFMDFVSFPTGKSEQKAWRLGQNQVFMLLAIESTCEAI